MHRALILSLLVAWCLTAQHAALPLDSVAIEGSAIPKPAILEIAGLEMGAQIDNAGMEQAARKLRDTGIFSVVRYQFAQGPEKGYALTLTLTDQPLLCAATIDIPAPSRLPTSSLTNAWR